MSKKIITFLHMSKAYRGIAKGNAGLCEKQANIVISSDGNGAFTESNYFDMLNELSSHNSVRHVNYAFMMSKRWTDTFCGGKNFARKDISEKFRIYYTCSSDSIRKMLKKSDLVIIRGNYSEWNLLLRHINCKLIFLPCWARISPDTLLPK